MAGLNDETWLTWDLYSFQTQVLFTAMSAIPQLELQRLVDLVVSY